MNKFSLITLGCKINQYETEIIKEAWEREGFEFVQEPSLADFVILNTCAVTDKAVQDARKRVRKCVRENPDIKIILTGCAVTVFEEELRSLSNIFKLIPQEEKIFSLCKNSKVVAKDFFRARAVVKIQDGCSYFCSYCIVPHARGKPISRDPDEILKEIFALVEKGFKEIIISGINLGQFEFRGGDLWDFILWLEDVVSKRYGDKVRFRLSSLDPGLLDLKGLKVLKKTRLLCPHLHISVQSGSERILKLMNRSHYTPGDIKEFIKKLKRDVWDIFGLSGDFLVGFPGEKEEDFLLTYEFCKELPFTHGHVFSFSPRPKTKAFKIQGHVDYETKKRRNRMLRELFNRKKKEFIQLLYDTKKVLDVVIEDEKNLGGMSEYYLFCRFASKRDVKKKDRVKAIPLGLYKENEVLVDFYESP